MLLIKYNKDGLAYSDFNLEADALKIYYKYLSKCGNPYDTDFMSIDVSTSNIITVFRMFVAEGTINHKRLSFEFDGEQFKLNELGNFEENPKSYLKNEIDTLFRILNANKKR